MDDTLAVGVGQHLGRAAGHVRRLLDAQGAVVLEDGIQGAARDEIHDQIQLTLVVAVVMDGGNARVP